MIFQRFKPNSFCVGGRHRSSTRNIYGDITSKGSKKLIGHGSDCKGKTFMTVTNNTLQVKGLGDFFKNPGKKGLNVTEEIAKNVLKILDEHWK